MRRAPDEKDGREISKSYLLIKTESKLGAQNIMWSQPVESLTSRNCMAILKVENVSRGRT